MAAAAIAMGFIGLLITTRIITDICHLFAHRRDSRIRGAERSRSVMKLYEADHGDAPRDTMIVYYRSRVSIFGIRAFA